MILFLIGSSCPDAVLAETERPPPRPEALSDLIHEALENNPSIKSIQLEVHALHATTESKWYLDPPEIGIDFYQTPLSSFPNPIKGQKEIDYSVKQAFPFPGKIAARIDAEHKHGNMGEADLQLAKNSLKLKIKTIYYSLYLWNKRIQFNQENQSRLFEQSITARQKYEQGLGKQIDLLRIESELTQLTSEGLSLEQSKQANMLELLTILNRMGNVNVTVTDTLQPMTIKIKEEQLTKIIAENHPAFKNIERAKEMQLAQQNMARKEFYPDFVIGGAYKDMLNNKDAHGQSIGENFWSVNATMTLPFAFWSSPKYKAGVNQYSIKLLQVDEELKSTRNQLTSQAKAAYLNVINLEKQQKIIEEQLIPQSEQTLASTEIAYRNGKADFKDLLEANQLQLSIKQNLATTQTQIMISQAELEFALGADLNTISGELK